MRDAPRHAPLALNPWTREQESRTCRKCGAAPGKQCVTASGTRAPLPHMARFYDAQESDRTNHDPETKGEQK